MIKYAQQYPVSPLGQHTKCFLKHLRGEAYSFQQYITGIPTESECAHYTTLMILRVMVLYFLQHKELLAGDPHYLSSQLQQIQEQHDKDRFYRCFLLPLFHDQINAGTSNKICNLQTIPLFADHQVEQEHAEIQIADEAFARLFALFNHYDWQLIEAGEAARNTLYPTVLSDFLEQQINQKQTGAYYTGKDVTGYICENSIVPHLLAEAGLRHPGIFGSAGSAWHLLRENPDRYIRAELRHEEMLPLETTREYDMRRTRYHQLRELLLSGGVGSGANMVTHNLAIAQFALDAIEHCQHREALRAFYASLEGITVLDPTCGTGALLIEALNMLQIFYRGCLESMQAIEDTSDEKQRKHSARTHTHNTSTLARIITNNLYGVDVVEEAADICAARLILTALGYSATAEESKALMTLECNIRHGNALIGRVKADGEIVEDECSESGVMTNKRVAREFHWNREYREVMQQGGFAIIIGNPPYIEYSKVRAHYQAPDCETDSCGNLYAAVIERAIALSRPGKSRLGLIVPLSICGGERFTQLRTTMGEKLGELWLANFEIFPARLFEGAFQRLTVFLATHDSQQSCITHVTKIQRWYTPERPQLIALMQYTNVQSSFIAGVFPKLASWQQEAILRKVQQRAGGHKLGEKIQAQHTTTFVYYQEATNYWAKAVCRVPYYKKNGIVKEPPHGRFLYLEDATTAHIIMAIMNSSLFYTWFATFSDGFHLAHALVREFPLVDDLAPLRELATYAQRLEQEISRYARRSTRNTRVGENAQQVHLIELEEYRMRYCKSLLDEIDAVLAGYYGLSDEELKFIINYDIKYRMGRE